MVGTDLSHWLCKGLETVESYCSMRKAQLLEGEAKYHSFLKLSTTIW